MDKEKAFEQEVYKKTSESMQKVVKELPTYAKIMESFNAGNNEVELRRRYMLKKLDETWVNAIEKGLPSLDKIIRNPEFRLEEREEVLPVEISRHINGRSVIHLSQHTDLINEVKDDGSVVPSKLLNVFQEDTVLTYENKFINTLVNRLFGFIHVRYSAAKENGQDEKNTSLSIKQDFEHGEYKGKVKFEIEIEQPSGDEVVDKNYVYTTDLYKRMEKLYTVISEYMSSPFILNMGKNFIHPPVMRTNALLKNPLFKDCLSLWEFIESYENTGYETTVKDDLLKASEKMMEDMYNSIAEQYVLFQTHILNGFEDNETLASRELTVQPNFKDLLDEPEKDEFDYETLLPDLLKDEPPLEAPECDIEFAIKVALAADELMYQDLAEEDNAFIDKDGNIKYRYKYSFLARLIRAQLPTQDYYNEIKNELLSYKKVKSLLSWPRELFKAGRNRCCKLNCKGKTLFVYLPLDPTHFDEKKYHHLNVTKEKGITDYPFLLKVRSKRACKYAKELIAIVMANYGIAKNDNYIPVDFHMAPMSIEELLEKDLARVIDEPVQKKESGEVSAFDISFEYKYAYSFEARVTLSQERQELYNQIKNELLSYEGIKSLLSWPRELFRQGWDKVAELKMKGKTLCLYLPLDPDKYDYKHFHHESLKGKNKDFNLLLRIRSNRAVKYAIELIKDSMANLGINKNEKYVVTNYKFKDRSFEELLAEGLIKILGNPKPVLEEKKDEVPDITSFEYKYSYSFESRVILGDKLDFYNEIKNELYSYKGIKSLISWPRELFRNGWDKVAELKMKGKTLCLYLNVDPKKFDASHYHIEDLSKKNKDFKTLLRIRSARAVKYAKELIAQTMSDLEILRNENYVEQDYRFAVRTFEKLIAEGLIKALSGEPISEEPTIKTSKKVKSIGEFSFNYSFSFESRLILCKERQPHYIKIKNELLSYGRVKSLISWPRELFRDGWNKVAELKMKGKTLCLYLPLDPEQYDEEHYHFENVSDKNKDFGLLLRIRSDRAVKYAFELISETMKMLGLEKNNNFVPENIVFKQRTTNELIEDGLIKILGKQVQHIEPNLPQEEAHISQKVVNNNPFGFEYSYSYSFESRLILCKERQPHYSEIKNELLSYRVVKSLLSWPRELFRNGWDKVAELKMKGKTLCLYLPLNPNEFDQQHYHFEDVSKKNKDFPLLLRIKSDRAVKYAKELISASMEKLGLNKDENYIPFNYEYEDKTLEELISEGLVKLLSSNVKQVVVKDEPKTEVVEEEKTEVKEVEIKEHSTFNFEFSYSYSFEARLSLEPETLERYNAIKNELISYQGIKPLISWPRELFRNGWDKVAELKMKGKALVIYLPLDPANLDQGHYHFEDVSNKNKDFKLMLRIKSDRAVKYAKELISDSMQKLGIGKQDDYVPQNYKFKVRNFKELFAENLIKKLGGEK